MTDRPIIFSGSMIRALLDGRKTQTRRLLKPQPSEGNTVINDSVMGPRALLARAKYKTGDRLWVREAHYMTDTGDYEIAVYAEDADAVREHFDLINAIAAKHNLPDTWKVPHLKLRPSIHMPRWASRLTLTITDVRVQRVQDISEADARAEGVESLPDYWVREDAHIGGSNGDWIPNQPPVPAYRALWNSLHGADAWEANPWVVALTFTVQRGNIDAA